jgi:polyisoprenyl-phosphate glycosyltransferase
MNHISIVTPCYNEEENVIPLRQAVKQIMNGIENCTYEHIFIDNCSEDKTPELLKEMAENDPNVKVIFNSRNFGHIRSPYYGLLQATGDAAILMASDFQDPPEMIEKFVQKWFEGNEIVIGVKEKSKESPIMFLLRTMYYKLSNKLSNVSLFENFTGFGLYDRVVINNLKKIEDPYPYFRGIIAEIGYNVATVPFVQPKREKGSTKNNFYTLYDIAMLGITSNSKVPLRIATMAGVTLSLLSLFTAFGYFIAKLIFWDSFSLGTAPIIIGLFFFNSILLFFIGIIGEYLGFIYTQVMKRPIVIEKDRINF